MRNGLSLFFLGLILSMTFPAKGQGGSPDLEPIKLTISIQEDLSRKPIAKAICRIFEDDQVKAQYISDEEGNIRIGIEPYKLVYLDVIADGFFQVKEPIDTRDLSQIKWATRISMMKEGWYRFKGVLLDEAFENFVPGIQMKMYDRTQQRTYLTTSNERGVYFFTLIPGHNYNLMVDDKDYLKTRSSILDCQDKESDDDGKGVFCTSGFALLDFKKDWDTGQKMIVGTTRLQKLELNKVYQVENIYYDYGKASIRSDAKLVLENLYQMLKDNPNIQIELAAHTDSRGKDEFNLNLSQKRAESVVAFLIGKGIPKSRLIAKGYGEKKLLNRCKNGVDCTDKEHQANRRTEFKIVGFVGGEPIEGMENRKTERDPEEILIEEEVRISPAPVLKPVEKPVVRDVPEVEVAPVKEVKTREIPPPAVPVKEPAEVVPQDTSKVESGATKKAGKKKRPSPGNKFK